MSEKPMTISANGVVVTTTTDDAVAAAAFSAAMENLTEQMDGLAGPARCDEADLNVALEMPDLNRKIEFSLTVVKLYSEAT